MQFEDFLTNFVIYFLNQFAIPGHSGGEKFKILLQALLGPQNGSWIVVDDLYIASGECHKEPPNATPIPPISK